jgi:phosphoadenosine phosphosulfate reductase
MSLSKQQIERQTSMSTGPKAAAAAALRVFPEPDEDPETPAAAAAPLPPPQVTRRVPEATDDYFAYLREQSARLETATPAEIIRWAVAEFHPKLTMATAFGPEGMVIIHLLSQIEPKVPVFNLDTGYQFKETLELRDRVLARYGIDVELRRPDTTVEE